MLKQVGNINKKSLVARLVITHQVLNCLFCNQLTNCNVTKSLTKIAMTGFLDPDAIETMGSCGYFNTKEITNLIRRADEDVVSNLLRLLLRRVSRRTRGFYVFREGSIINLGDYLLVIDKEDSRASPISLAESYEFKTLGSDCVVLLNKVHNDYLNYLLNVVSKVVPNGEYSLSSLIQARERFLSAFIEDEGVISALLLASLGLGDLSPLLLSQDIEDVFITHDALYINHVKYGICRVLNADPRSLAVQFLKLANAGGIRVSVDNPSGKFSLSIGGRKVRVVIDRWPLVEGIAVHIRLHKRAFTITDLVNLGTIDLLNASKLILAVRSGYGVLIMGPPSSGKTTLLNALDMAMPLRMRRIYVDEVDESLELPVPNVKVKSLVGKVEEILKSLHRGYGVLIIGELREREHFEALIHGANAGLQVLGTTHASDDQSLMNRLRAFSLHDMIDLSKYVLVVMEKVNNIRRVKSITYPPGFNPSQKQLTALSEIITKLSGVGDYVKYAVQLDKLITEALGD